MTNPQHGGDNPPILFLHGVFGSPGLMRPWLEYFDQAGFAGVAPALPGRDPSDREVLRRTGIDECLEVALAAYDALGTEAIVIGHSMGGLIAQKVAAARQCRALVLLASIPPGVLWPQLRPLPHLLPILPAVLAGRPFLPGERTMREVPLSTLTRAEQDLIVPRLVPDSGRIFRAMSLGAPSVRVDAGAVRCPVLCVSAGADRNVAPWISARLAARYRAEHQIHPGLPHWIIAESALPQVAPPVLRWLRDTLELPGSSDAGG
ncbi:alpha/beta hydrolase [Nocardia rhizosphaerae]|uniref:Alpha/beta hydrolase n=1 Tax=Nocardia rhizosphaerae TaxID=1691571 RepID=A0ABV8LDX4_9NOCA